MTDAGARRHRLQLQRFDGALDELNQPLDDEDEHWTTIGRPWAKITPIAGREFYAAEQAQSEVTHKIDIRYRPGVTADMRLKLGKRIFTIVGKPIDWEERHESLLIMARELQPKEAENAG